MLDIKFIRDNKDLVKDAVRRKRVDVDIEALLARDDERLRLLKGVEDLRARQNVASKEIGGRAESGAVTEKDIGSLRIAKEELKKEEKKLQKVMEAWRALMLRVPNIPDASVPDGESEADNKELKRVGTPPRFDFPPKDHTELMRKHRMVDFERGSKVHGFRGYFLERGGAALSWAIWNYAQDFFLKKNFVPFIAPTIVKKEFFYGTGHLPTDADDLYVTQDDDYLSGTAEVPMMAYHANEILDKASLPVRYLAFSPCFRREAGSYGKDTKGLFRVHEFFKLEQLILCEAAHEESVKYHEEINRNTEEFIESLGLPYRQVAICAGDLKTAQVKSYDTELWVPSDNAYREIASASYYHDFQTRRFNIRYHDAGGKKYAHSLNGTAIPTPRTIVALVENYQDKNGRITIPPALRPYFGKEVIS